MDIGAILIGISIVLICLAVIYDPFRRLSAETAGNHKEADLFGEQRTTILQQILALDFDHELGQISDEDYRNLRESLLVEAGGLEKEMKSWANEQLEALIIDRRQKRAPVTGTVCHACNASLQPDDRFCRFCGASQGTSCPACHAPISNDSNFCPQCGHSMMETV